MLILHMMVGDISYVTCIRLLIMLGSRVSSTREFSFLSCFRRVSSCGRMGLLLREVILAFRASYYLLVRGCFGPRGFFRVRVIRNLRCRSFGRFVDNHGWGSQWSILQVRTQRADGRLPLDYRRS